MNFTGGNTLPNIGRRINWQLVTLAGGLAVALSAGALAGVFERDRPPATTAVTRPADVPVSRPVAGDTASVPSEMLYVLVGSQAEADLLVSTAAGEAEAYPDYNQGEAVVSFMAIETAAEKAQFDQTLAMSTAELMVQGTNVRVLDLREVTSPAISPGSMDGGAGEPSENLVYIVGSQAEKVVLEQQFHEASAHAVDDTRRSVILVDSPEQEAILNTMAGEQMATGAFEIVDLR